MADRRSGRAADFAELWNSGVLVKCIAYQLNLTIGQAVSIRRRLALPPRRLPRWRKLLMERTPASCEAPR